MAPGYRRGAEVPAAVGREGVQAPAQRRMNLVGLVLSRGRLLVLILSTGSSNSASIYSALRLPVGEVDRAACASAISSVAPASRFAIRLTVT